MRYFKGSVALNQAHDYPLLRQVLRSRFVTRSQLFEFIRLGGYERDRKVFNWRLHRLVVHGFISQHQTPSAGTEAIYSISAIGAALLQGTGECFVPLPTPRSPQKREINVLHSVELNDIRLTLVKAGIEILWISEGEIRSRNELTHFKFAKDYDAVVTVAVNSHSARFALEYERTAKKEREYLKVANELSGERAVERVLYLSPSYHILSFVADYLKHVHLPIFFGLAPAWHSKLLDMPVSSAHGKRHATLREVLE
jgi:DNA-binding PadR family transcriptional regulator